MNRRQSPRPQHRPTSRHALQRIGLAGAALGCALVLSGSMTGCHLFRRGETATTKPVLESTTSSGELAVPAALQPMNRPVVQGPLPQVYLVETDSNIRVTNVATGEEVARFPAKASQIIRVETRGVLLQNKPVMGAQLAQGVYAIHVDGPEAGTVNVEQTRSVPTLPPAKPAADAPATEPPASRTSAVAPPASRPATQ